MKCKACNKTLSDHESTKSDSNGDYYDLCRVCLNISFDAPVDTFVSQLDNNCDIDKIELDNSIN